MPQIPAPARAPTDHADARPVAGAPPRILLTATLRWPIAARLGMAFAELGCHVEVVCPAGHPAEFTRAVRRTHRQAALDPMGDLRRAIARATPDLLIPCDDDAALHLHRLHAASRGDDAAPAALRELIERSLGTPLACTLATTRGQLIALARELGIQAPATRVITSTAELAAGLAQSGWPAVLKTDRSWGGQGVAVVHDRDEAMRAFAALATGPTWRQSLTRLLLDRDAAPLRELQAERPRTLTLQAFVAGPPANRAVVCWRGRVLAGTSVLAVHTQGPTGPATVVRVIENPQMADAVERLVARLGLSGFWGADFVISAADGTAHLVELNPRATPICHLAITAAPDLPAALVGAWLGRGVARPRRWPGDDTVALFPGEWQRDPASAELRTGHHDVPWQEPALVLDGIRPPWARRGLLARARARWRSGRAAEAPLRTLPLAPD